MVGFCWWRLGDLMGLGGLSGGVSARPPFSGPRSLSGSQLESRASEGGGLMGGVMAMESGCSKVAAIIC